MAGGGGRASRFGRKHSAANTSKSNTSSVCVIGAAHGPEWLEKRYETGKVAALVPTDPDDK